MNIAADDDLCTDDGVDVRGSVKGHRQRREALKGMLSCNIESRSRVFVFRMISSTHRHRRSAHKGSLIGETQRN